MANIKQILAAKEAAKKAAEEAARRPEWEEAAEDTLISNPKIARETVQSFAKRIREGGYPKNLTFCGVCVQISDEKDLAEFWKTIYANLSKEELEALSEPNHQPISELQVRDALMRLYRRSGVAKDLVDNDIDQDALEFACEGKYYVVAGGMVIDLNGEVIADVSDLETPFGPDEWVEVSNRVKAAEDARNGEWDDLDDEPEDEDEDLDW